MDALEALTRRVSVPVLSGPDVTDEQIETLIVAALRAADHAWLRPSRYLVVRGDALNRLGEVFASTESSTADEARLHRLRSMPLRAPLIIVAITAISHHPKVPETEQLMSTAAGVQNILNAAWAMGLGAVWRTGNLAYHPDVHKGLGLAKNEKLTGFVYVGHIAGAVKSVPELDVHDFVKEW
tara:strand:- start:331 stop:876 length:546 start_codon:yes stop_codon:yes gene_type:complete